MYRNLEEGLGYIFQNRKLLENALTHSSYANENRERGLPDNERLERAALAASGCDTCRISPYALRRMARVLRQRLRKRGITHLQVVYSTEPPLTPREAVADGGRRQLPGSVSFVPPAAGLAAAGAVVRALCEKE